MPSNKGTLSKFYAQSDSTDNRFYARSINVFQKNDAQSIFYLHNSKKSCTFVANLKEGELGSSNPLIAEGIHTKDLQPGQSIEVTWLPNRRCVFRYFGDMRFEVVESVNSKLSVGDTFTSTFFLTGQPLYMDQLLQSAQPPVSYVAGNSGGLQSVTLLT